MLLFSLASFELPPLVPLPSTAAASVSATGELTAAGPLPLLPVVGASSLPLPLPLPTLPPQPQTSLVAPLPVLPLPLPLDNTADAANLGSVHVGSLAVDYTAGTHVLPPPPVERVTSPVSPSDPFLGGPTDLRHSFLKREAPLTPPASMSSATANATTGSGVGVGQQHQQALPLSLSAADIGHLPPMLSSMDSTSALSSDINMSSAAVATAGALESSEIVTNSSVVGMDMLGDGMSMSMAMHDVGTAASSQLQLVSSANDTLSSMIGDNDLCGATASAHPNFADDISVFHDTDDVRAETC